MTQRRVPTWVGRPSLAAVVLGVSFLSLLLGALAPEWVIADAGHDDLLFVRGADALRAGEWLGAYDNRTLLKGPGFPMWLALVQPLGLLVANQLLHLLAAGVLSAVVARLLASPRAGLVLFVVLALDPSYFGAGAVRVTRDAWYSSLCLLLLAVTVLVLLRPASRAGTRLDSFAFVLAGGGALGLLGALYWLGREERVWLVPSLAVLALVPLLRWRRASHGEGTQTGPSPRGAVALGLVAVVVAGLVSAASVALVADKNEAEYGAQLVTDFADGAFVDAYGRWQSVEAGQPRPFVPVSAAQRAAVYAVSPAAAQLEPALEGPLKSWVAPGCQALQVCDDFAGGWFPFALRDAAAETGNYRDADAAQDFFHTVAREIARACTDGRLRCQSVPSGLAPVRSQIRLGEVLRSGWEGAVYLAGFGVAETSRPASAGSPANYEVFRSTIGGLPLTLEDQQREERKDAWRAGAAEGLAEVYTVALVVLLAPALLGYVLALTRRRGGLAVVVGAACGGAVVVRLTLLALVDATSFPAATTSYVLPASSFLLAFVVLGCGLLVGALRRPSGTAAAQRGGVPA